MKEIEYLIVGDGYGALFFAHQLLKHEKSFLLFSEGKKSASHISAGIVNPVVLKKFTTFDRAMEQIEALHQTLEEMETYTGVNYFVDEPISRIFHDQKERELWERKALDPLLAPFLSLDFSTLDGLLNPFGVGKVNHSGRIRVEAFFSDLRKVLQDKNALLEERFDYERLNPEKRTYRDIPYKYVVFAEGMGVKENPYFKQIPVNPNKGHQINVELKDLESLSVVVKKKHFLFLSEKNRFYYGGTYDRHSESLEVEPTAIEQLTNGLSEFYEGSILSVDPHFGFRPTVKDRRPILGGHKEHAALFVLNGLGARGVLNGNFYAKQLFDHIDKESALSFEVDLKRFDF
ncbi:NAD(P)/FAD-dependent oxidoreductase [Chryseobacterium sp. A301]